jgi:hypothetical protein
LNVETIEIAQNLNYNLNVCNFAQGPTRKIDVNNSGRGKKAFVRAFNIESNRPRDSVSNCNHYNFLAYDVQKTYLMYPRVFDQGHY